MKLAHKKFRVQENRELSPNFDRIGNQSYGFLLYTIATNDRDLNGHQGVVYVRQIFKKR